MNFLAFGLDVPRQSSSPGSLCSEESKYTSRKSMCSKHMHSNHQPGHLQDNLSSLSCRLTIGSNVSIPYRKKKKNLLKDIEGEKGLLNFLVLKKNSVKDDEKQCFKICQRSKSCQTPEIHITSVIIFLFTPAFANVAVVLHASSFLDHA